MSATLVVLAAAALGIEVGWQPLAEGGHEYTIQIEPQVLDLLRRGQNEVASEVPPDVEVRRLRLVAGQGKLPRVTGTPGLAALPPRPEANASKTPQEQPDSPSSLQLPATTASETPPTSAVAGPSTNRETSAAAQIESDAATPPVLDALPPGASETVSAAKPPAPGASSTSEPARPWTAFIATLVILCCSLGANIYLGWSTWEARNRWRAALAKAHAATS
jgi:hypothetical protein